MHIYMNVYCTVHVHVCTVHVHVYVYVHVCILSTFMCYIYYSSDVRAGSQHSLRMFISHTRQLFLHDAPTGMISNQVDSGKKIIKFYQEIMSQWSLDLEGWIYLLKVILHLCLVLLKDSVPPQLPTLGTNMADILLQVNIINYMLHINNNIYMYSIHVHVTCKGNIIIIMCTCTCSSILLGK